MKGRDVVELTLWTSTQRRKRSPPKRVLSQTWVPVRYFIRVKTEVLKNRVRTSPTG